MSTSVDERVVSMKFDNKQFESNAKVSMTTLERLKEKLNFTGAAKGLENVNSAAKNINMAGLGNAVETVRVKFSALEVMAVTALANITNSAVNAGKRMVSALTVDPIMSGFKEYETQINAVQTILANTQSKGTTLDQVNAALDELNLYADKTIYNFTEMTRNIGTFTAAGIELDTAVESIKGIANLAAVSGSTSQQASVAMYQLSQALASGTVKLMDWNSVVNAGMGGQVFQDALKETARIHGVAIDKMIKDEGSFRETLQKGWLTSEILTETLSKFTMTTDGLTEAQIESNKQMLLAKGYSEEQVEAIFKLGQTATDAATKVKTFSQLWDTLKEAAQSGWTQTWEIIVGDFEEAKEFLTRISDAVGAVIQKMSDTRNALLEDALGSKWNKLTERINEAGIETDKFTEKLREVAKENNIKGFDTIIEECGSLEKAFASGKLSGDLITKTLKSLAGANDKAATSTGDMTKKLEYFQDVVDRVWGGEFKTAPVRYQLLTEAGYDYKVVQDLVNKTVDGHRLTLEDLSNVQLESIGYTEEEIKAIRELADEAEKADSPLNKLISDIEKPSGRTLLIESLFNIMKGIGTVATTAGNAMRKVFEPIKADQIYGAVEALNKFTEKLANLPAETTWDLYRAFRGLFTAISLVAKFINTGFTIAIEIVKAVLEYFNMDLIDLAATIGDYIVELKAWIDEHNILADGLKAIIPLVIKAAEAIVALVTAIKDSGAFGQFIETLSPALASIWNWVQGIKDAKNIPMYLISGLVNGLKEGIPLVIGAVFELGKSILDTICQFLGINSPSTKMYEVGMYTVEGLSGGIKDNGSIVDRALDKIKEFFTGFIDDVKNLKTGEALEGPLGGILDFFKNIDFGSIFGKLISFIKNIDFGSVLAAAISGGFLYSVNKISDALSVLASPFEGLGDLFESLGKSVTTVSKAFSKKLKAEALESKSKAILNFAIAIGILAASVYLLTKPSDDELKKALITVSILTGIVLTLAGACILLSKAGGFGTLSVSLLGLSAALLILVGVAKMLSGMSWGDMGKAAAGFGGLLVIITFLMLISKIAKPAQIAVFTVALKEIAKSLVILAVVAKILATMSWDELGKAAAGFGGLLVIITFLMLISKIAKPDKLAVFCLALTEIAKSLAILAVVAKLLSSMAWDEFAKAGVGLLGLVVIVGILIAIVNKFGKNAPVIASTLNGIAASMLILTIVAKLIGSMSWGNIAKAAVGLFGLTAIVEILVAIVNKYGKNAPKIAGTLIGISLAIGILAAIAIVLSLIKLPGLIKGIAAVGFLTSFMSGLLIAAGFANKSTGTIVALAVTIAIMAGALAALTLLNPIKLAVATAALAVIMHTLAAVIISTAFAKKSTGTVIALAVLIGILTGALIALSILPWEKVLAASVGLSVVMLALAGAVKLMSGSLGGAIGFGVVILSLAAGFLMLSGALAILSTIGPSGISTLTLLATTILNLIPYAIQKLGEGVIAFAQVIIAAAPVIAAAVVTVITTVVTAIATTAPTIATTILMTLTMLLTLLSVFVPQFVEAGLNLLVGILKAIRDHIGDVVTTAAEIVVNFIEAIAEKLPDVIQAGFDLILAFLEGMASAIENNGGDILIALFDLFTSIFKSIWKLITDKIPELKDLGSEFINSGFVQGIIDKFEAAYEAVSNLINKAKEAVGDKVSEWVDAGKNLIGGFIKGIGDKASELVDAAKGVVSNALEGAKKLLGINSPSKEFAKLGRYSDEGMIVGLKKYAGGVSEAAKDVGEGALNSMSVALSRVSDIIDSDMDMTPTIRPVIDLTDVENGNKRLSSIFGSSRSITVDSARIKASKLAGDINSAKADTAANQNGPSFSFTQNNYSPKALSQIDIYRQTKNQFSAMKGVLSKA